MNDNIKKAIEWAEQYKGTEPIKITEHETVINPQRFLQTQILILKKESPLTVYSYRLIKKFKDAVTAQIKS
jgi:hypothetical protein